MSFILHERAGIRFYTSTVLPCPHAFSTRVGGVSTLPHLSGLNLGRNRGDAPGNPEKNLSLFLDAAGLPPRAVQAKQIHSDILAYANGASDPDGVRELDGFYTDLAGVTLLVKVADCLPILLCDRESGAVAAVHAGWRGSAKRIAAKGVEALVSLGAKRERIAAAIGPSIGKCCFEVRDDFIAAFLSEAGAHAGRYIETRGGRTYADLQSFNRDVLTGAGVPEDAIDVSPECTCCRPDLFFSHRYTGGLRGTMGAAIAKRS
ncbi:MAG: peptidoglycan editing factor PgeF [Clostridia bacterium]|nr:peptidoglycan editing factor PgeF [Clostridia bacterium]